MYTHFSWCSMKGLNRALFLALICVTLLAGCAAPRPNTGTPAAPPPAASYAAPDFSASVTGHGAIRNQFVLQDPQSHQPAAMTPYHLAIRGMALSNNPKLSWDGVTDGQGRTVTVLSGQPISDEDVVLVRRFGEGPYGELFQMLDPGEKPLAGMPVTIRLCDGHTFDSVSDAKGYVGYVAAQQPCSVQVSLRFAHMRVSEGHDH